MFLFISCIFEAYALKLFPILPIRLGGCHVEWAGITFLRTAVLLAVFNAVQRVMNRNKAQHFLVHELVKQQWIFRRPEFYLTP
jgi:hypothetical protein